MKGIFVTNLSRWLIFNDSFIYLINFYKQLFLLLLKRVFLSPADSEPLFRHYSRQRNRPAAAFSRRARICRLSWRTVVTVDFQQSKEIWSQCRHPRFKVSRKFNCDHLIGHCVALKLFSDKLNLTESQKNGIMIGRIRPNRVRNFFRAAEFDRIALKLFLGRSNLTESPEN